MRKHVHASSVHVRLQHTSPRTLMVTIQDDGIGLPDDFDLTSLPAKERYDLQGIGERVALLGGRLRIQRQASGETLPAG